MRVHSARRTRLPIRPDNVPNSSADVSRIDRDSDFATVSHAPHERFGGSGTTMSTFEKAGLRAAGVGSCMGTSRKFRIKSYGPETRLAFTVSFEIELAFSPRYPGKAIMWKRRLI